MREVLTSTAQGTTPSSAHLLAPRSRVVNAISSVVNYIITDAFNLSVDESLWFGFELDGLLAPLNDKEPTLVLGAVQEELDSHAYSNRMFRKAADNPDGIARDTFISPDARYAPLSSWVESLGAVILTGYPNLRPMLRSQVIGSLHGLLVELGLSEDVARSRPSEYLPNAIRTLLNSTH